MRSPVYRNIWPRLAVASILLLSATRAWAVASFSRQTGLACTACHTTFPELNAMGREFKLNGYTLSANQDISDKGDGKDAPLSLSSQLPLSIDFRASTTTMRRPLATSAQDTANSSVEFPQQANFFFAGKLGEHVGSYIQMTYSKVSNHFNIDNSDFLRYADSTKLFGKDLVYGLDINNNPTFEDLWNSTPAYGFPWAAPGTALTPNAATIIDGGLAGDVVGLGGYMLWDNHWYAILTGYRSMHVGGPEPATGTGYSHNIEGAAPYWRLAWTGSQGPNQFMIGTYGISVKNHPGALNGLTDDYRDIAGDFQYERSLGSDSIVFHGTYIHENQDLKATLSNNGAGFADHSLNTARIDGSYHWGTRISALLGVFRTTGTADPMLYAPAALTGSNSGEPNNNGYVAQLAFFPIQNMQIGTQYRYYSKFNGTNANYDGAGRSALANNTLYIYLWMSL